MSDILLAGHGRLWVIENRAGPARTPVYQLYGMAGSMDWGQGDVEKIEIPSDTQYSRWVEIASYRSASDRATLPMTFRMTDAYSVLMRLVELRCALDVQIHWGVCEDPRDFNFGWQKIRVFEDAALTSYSTTDMMAMQEDDESGVDEEGEISAKTVFDILRMGFTTVAGALVSEEIVAVDVCDRIQCGNCGNPSDGCKVVLALSNPAGSSPGILPQVIFTEDAYATAAERVVTTMALGSTANDGECVGTLYVVVSVDDPSGMHYCTRSELLDLAETWTAINTGFVAGGEPKAISSVTPLHTWIFGAGGYVYFTADPTGGVTVQDAGVAAAGLNLYDVEAFSTELVIACGENNAFVYTEDGLTWGAVTGPSVGNDLLACAFRNEGEWWVGDDAGSVFYTIDKGVTWTEVTTLKGTVTEVNKIVWANETVGFIATREAGPAGYIQRTISGGNTWYKLPETAGAAIPANDYINDIAVCENQSNILFAGGLSDGGADGILLKGSYS